MTLILILLITTQIVNCFLQNCFAGTVGIILLSVPTGDFVLCPPPRSHSIRVGANEACISD